MSDEDRNANQPADTPGMTISPRPRDVRFDADLMVVRLEDGREIGVPYAWFPRLAKATPEQRIKVELSATGLHWDEIDEDISIAGLLAGHGDLRAARGKAA